MATKGVLFYSTTFVGLNVVLSTLVWQLRHTHRSRSLLMIQVTFAIHAGACLNRLYQYAMTGLPEYLDVFSFSWVSNLVTLSSILAIVLICFGYWGFTLEKSNSENHTLSEVNGKPRPKAKPCARWSKNATNC